MAKPVELLFFQEYQIFYKLRHKSLGYTCFLDKEVNDFLYYYYFLLKLTTKLLVEIRPEKKSGLHGI